VLFGSCVRSASSDTPAAPPDRQRSNAKALSTDCTLDTDSVYESGMRNGPASRNRTLDYDLIDV
jgi:hypothetical protein